MIRAHDHQVILDRQKDQRPDDKTKAAKMIRPRKQITPLALQLFDDFWRMMVLEQHGFAGDLHNAVEYGGSDITVDCARRLTHAVPIEAWRGVVRLGSLRRR